MVDNYDILKVGQKTDKHQIRLTARQTLDRKLIARGSRCPLGTAFNAIRLRVARGDFNPLSMPVVPPGSWVHAPGADHVHVYAHAHGDLASAFPVKAILTG